MTSLAGSAQHPLGCSLSGHRHLDALQARSAGTEVCKVLQVLPAKRQDTWGGDPILLMSDFPASFPPSSLPLIPSTHLCFFPFINLSAHPPIHQTICPSIHPCIHPFTYSSTHSSILSSIHPPTHPLSVHPSIHPSILPTIHPSFQPSIHLSIHVHVYLPLLVTLT